IVHIPMEPLNKALNPGPHALKVSQNTKKLRDEINWNLSQFDGYVGVNNHMGSRITTNKRAMNQVMAELKSRDLFFVDSRTIGSSVAAQSARDAGISYAVRDIFLDHEVTQDFISNALIKLENKAKTRGYAIAIGHPHKETIAALKAWLPTLEGKGLALVPVSQLLNRPASTELQAKAQ
ncbi:MAG: divergent polysaccharide deacetylase family protein, partial [Alphaproteobacteria bacterium]|nr:divergent polysaccharide deacetylase family protein [Alphaproteobacteria bacterium]